MVFKGMDGERYHHQQEIGDEEGQRRAGRSKTADEERVEDYVENERAGRKNEGKNRFFRIVNVHHRETEDARERVREDDDRHQVDFFQVFFRAQNQGAEVAERGIQKVERQNDAE
jgi:hypothetical protein